MSKNALALVDCNNREQLYQFLVETFDRKAARNEMISPYDDQLIGKMNFRYSGEEHAMFFTYARSSEYPGMRFRNHKIIYLSLNVSPISADIFNQICARFGGFVDYDDDLDGGWQKIERVKPLDDDTFEPAVLVPEEAADEADPQQEIRQILKLDRKNERAEGGREPRRKEKPERRTDKGERGERKDDSRRGPRNDRREGGKNNNRNRNGEKNTGEKSNEKNNNEKNNNEKNNNEKNNNERNRSEKNHNERTSNDRNNSDRNNNERNNNDRKNNERKNKERPRAEKNHGENDHTEKVRQPVKQEPVREVENG